MKYFTYELWKSFNSSDEIVRKKANHCWMINIELYKNEFKKIEDKFSKNFLGILKKNDYFHDFYLSEVKIQQNSRLKYPTKVSLLLTQGNDVFEVTYNNVKKINLNYSFETNELGFGNGFCTCGYSEFFEIDEKLLSHEILFSSGATILVWFEKVKAKRKVILMPMYLTTR